MRQTKYDTYHETKKHTSEEFPYNTYLCSIPLDFTLVPLHWHTEMEIIAIKKGEGIVSVNLVQYQVKAGDFIVVLPGCLHSISALGYALMEYENIIFKSEILKSRNSDSCNLLFLNPLLNGLIDFPVLIRSELSYYDGICSSIEQMDHFSKYKPEGYQLAIKSCLLMFFFHLLHLSIIISIHTPSQFANLHIMPVSRGSSRQSSSRSSRSSRSRSQTLQ